MFCIIKRVSLFDTRSPDQGCQNRVLTRKIVRFYESKHALRVESFEKIENG